MDILDHPLIAQRYFFPQRVALPGAVQVPTPIGPLACWRSHAPSDRPVLVHFHGNGELVHHWTGDFADAIDSMGFDLFLAEYRGYGASAGAPLLGSMLGDLDSIAITVGVPQDQIVVFGRSVGSIFAIEWVRRFPTCRGLVIESGIHDVFQRLALRIGPEEMDLNALKNALDLRVNHHKTLQGYQGPSLYLHAEGDDLVSIEHAEANVRAAGSRGRLVRLPKGGHNSILYENQAKYLDELSGFLSASSRP